MTPPILSEVTPLTGKSFTIHWTINKTNILCNFIITWTNLHTGAMSNDTVLGNTTSYMVTELSGMHNYNVSVTANNSCGMTMSDPMTVYGKDVQCVCM